MRGLPALLVFFALIAGCASNDFTVSVEDSAVPEDAAQLDTEPFETTSADAGMSVDEACEKAAAAVCAKYAACLNVTFKTVWGTLATCRERVQIGCNRTLTMPGVRLTPDEQYACNLAAVSLSCPAFIDGAPRCAYTPGALGPGSACTIDNQCDTRYCQYVPGTLCGTCGAPPKEGESCVDRCESPALACVNKVCKRRAAGGEPCEPTSAPCVPSLVCSGGRCVKPAGKGEKCDATGATAPQCDVYPGLYCATSGVCAAFAFADAGSLCGSLASGYTLCTAASFCRVPTGVATGTCIAAAGEGAACNTTTGPNCISNSACVSGTCRIHDAAACK